MGQHHGLGLDDEGQVWAIGRGEYGRLGLGKEGDAVEPTKVKELEGVKCVQVIYNIKQGPCSKSWVWLFLGELWRGGELRRWGRWEVLVVGSRTQRCTCQHSARLGVGRSGVRWPWGSTTGWDWMMRGKCGPLGGASMAGWDWGRKEMLWSQLRLKSSRGSNVFRRVWQAGTGEGRRCCGAN